MSVRIDIQIGLVEILATERDDVSVTVSPSNPSRGGDRAAAEAVRVDRSGENVTVKGPQRRTLFGKGDSVEVQIEVPEHTDVNAVVKYGSARLAGHFGSVRAEVPYGEFSLDAADRLEKLKGGYGEYRAGHVATDAEVAFKSGRMRVGRVGGRLRLTGADGPITVDQLDGPAEVVTSSGGIEVGAATSDTTIRSAYGAVRVREAVRGVLRIDGSYGSVEVGVRRGTAVWLDAQSQYGVVRTDLSTDTGPATGDDTLELHLRTGYGSINVNHSDRP